MSQIPDEDVAGLTFDPDRNLLVLSTTEYNGGISNSKLWELNPSTGATVRELELEGPFRDAPFDLPAYDGIAYDAVNNQLYGASPLHDSLFEIDAQTGDQTFVDRIATSGAKGSTIDPSTGNLLVLSAFGAYLFEVDLVTGEQTLRSWVDRELDGVTVNPSNGTIHGNRQGAIYSVNVSTGATTLLVELEDSTGNPVTPMDIAFDDNGNLWGITDTHLFSANTSTGVITQIGSFESRGFQNNLIFAQGTLYENFSRELYAVDTTTGQRTLVRELQHEGYVDGLGFDASTGFFYSWDSVGSRAIRIDQTSGHVTYLGGTGVEGAGMTRLPGAQTIYVSGPRGLFSVDYSANTLTSVMTSIGNILALSASADGTLYGSRSLSQFSQTSNTELVVLDVANTSVTVVGNNGARIEGLALASDGTLFGSDGDTLYTVDIATGVATQSTPIDGCSEVFGLEFGGDGILYGVERELSSLVSVDTTTGACTVLFATPVTGPASLATR